MKKILLIAMIISSVNAQWIYVKDAEHLTIINDETGEIFKEFLGAMVRVTFTDSLKEVYDDNGNLIRMIPSPDRRNSPKK